MTAGFEQNLWRKNEKIIFRISFIFFVILCVPLGPSWYERLFSINVVDINYRDLYDIAGYSPDFIRINSQSGRWGIASYANWGITFLIALVLGFAWTIAVRRRDPFNYNKLYYWLRVIVRYRIAVGIIAFGFIKLFPQQMPFPSTTVLNTNLIDMQQQKLYWYSVGIVQPYEIFLGFTEVLGGFLLFFRRTTVIGATLVAIVLFNIGLANHAYDGGVHVYSFYFVLLCLFLLVKDFPKIWTLVVKRKDAVIQEYVDMTTYKKGFRFLRYLVIFIYIPFFTYVMFSNNFIRTKINKKPTSPALSGMPGFYNVTEFSINNNLLPYSPYDSVRWQSAIFENWSTFTFKVNKPVPINLGNGSSAKKDVDKNFEVSGIAGGQRFFYYEADTINKLLFLQDKNTPSSDSRSRLTAPTAKKERPKLIWKYERPTTDRIILRGRNESNDSIHVVLDRVNKNYPLVAGRNSIKSF